MALDLHGTIVATLSLEQDFHSLVDCAAHVVGIAAPGFSTEEIADQDWVRVTQAQFEPVLIGERLWIGPELAPAARQAASP